MERHYPYGAQGPGHGRRFACSVDETCFGRGGRSVNGYSRTVHPLDVRSSSKRARMSSSAPDGVDFICGLRFTSGEGSSTNTSHLIESWKISPRRRATSFCWTPWHFTIPLAFGLLPILSRYSAAFHSSVLYLIQPHQKNVFHCETYDVAPVGSSLKLPAHVDTRAHGVLLSRVLAFAGRSSPKRMNNRYDFEETENPREWYGCGSRGS